MSFVGQAAVLAWLPVAFGQSAASQTPISLESPNIVAVGCEQTTPPAILAEIRRIVALELEHATPEVQARAARAQLNCQAQAIGLSVGSRSVSVDLSKTDERVKARVVALSIVELAEYPDFAAQPEADAPVDTAPSSPSAKLPLWSLWAEFGATSFVHAPTFLPGGGLRLRLSDENWGVAGGVQASRGDTQLTLGSVTARSFSSDLTCEWLGRWPLGNDQLSLALLFGARVGYVNLLPKPSSPLQTQAKRLDAVWAGPTLGAFAGYPLGESWQVGLRAEGGITTLAPQALSNGQKEEIWRGPWFTGQATIGYVFESEP